MIQDRLRREAGLPLDWETQLERLEDEGFDDDDFDYEAEVAKLVAKKKAEREAEAAAADEARLARRREQVERRGLGKTGEGRGGTVRLSTVGGDVSVGSVGVAPASGVSTADDEEEDVGIVGWDDDEK